MRQSNLLSGTKVVPDIRYFGVLKSINLKRVKKYHLLINVLRMLRDIVSNHKDGSETVSDNQLKKLSEIEIKS